MDSSSVLDLFACEEVKLRCSLQIHGNRGVQLLTLNGAE